MVKDGKLKPKTVVAVDLFGQLADYTQIRTIAGKYDNVRIGMNSRLDTMQTVVLQVKLQAFREYELEAVNRVAVRYAVTTELCKRVLALPMHPYLDEVEQGKVIAAVKGYVMK